MLHTQIKLYSQSMLKIRPNMNIRTGITKARFVSITKSDAVSITAIEILSDFMFQITKIKKRTADEMLIQKRQVKLLVCSLPSASRSLLFKNAKTATPMSKSYIKLTDIQLRTVAQQSMALM